eukprot:SAG11_NODE_533_length_8703_cov_7.183054_2_plen_84_part_00
MTVLLIFVLRWVEIFRAQWSVLPALYIYIFFKKKCITSATHEARRSCGKPLPLAPLVIDINIIIMCMSMCMPVCVCRSHLQGG